MLTSSDYKILVRPPEIMHYCWLLSTDIFWNYSIIWDDALSKTIRRPLLFKDYLEIKGFHICLSQRDMISLVDQAF